jgi:hypothetical protein
MQLPTRGYHENVVDHYEKPRNVGSFTKGDPDVGTGLVGAPACGDVMKLQIKVGPWRPWMQQKVVGCATRANPPTRHVVPPRQF